MKNQETSQEDDEFRCSKCQEIHPQEKAPSDDVYGICLRCYCCSKCTPMITTHYEGEPFDEFMCIECVKMTIDNGEKNVSDHLDSNSFSFDHGWYLNIKLLQKYFTLTPKGECREEHGAARCK